MFFEVFQWNNENISVWWDAAAAKSVWFKCFTVWAASAKRDKRRSVTLIMSDDVEICFLSRSFSRSKKCGSVLRQYGNNSTTLSFNVVSSFNFYLSGLDVHWLDFQNKGLLTNCSHIMTFGLSDVFISYLSHCRASHLRLCEEQKAVSLLLQMDGRSSYEWIQTPASVCLRSVF